MQRVVNTKSTTLEVNPFPTEKGVMNMFRTLITLIKPSREGLINTNKLFWCVHVFDYEINLKEILVRIFEEVEGYNKIVIIKNILLELNCEHRILTILVSLYAIVHPKKRLVEISKLLYVWLILMPNGCILRKL